MKKFLIVISLILSMSCFAVNMSETMKSKKTQDSLVNRIDLLSSRISEMEEKIADSKINNQKVLLDNIFLKKYSEFENNINEMKLEVKEVNNNYILFSIIGTIALALFGFFGWYTIKKGITNFIQTKSNKIVDAVLKEKSKPVINQLEIKVNSLVKEAEKYVNNLIVDRENKIDKATNLYQDRLDQKYEKLESLAQEKYKAMPLMENQNKTTSNFVVTTGNNKTFKSLFYEGLELYNKKDFLGAIEKYSEAIKVFSNDSNTYGNRGMAYLEIEDYEHAINDFNKVIELDDNKSEGYNSRGVVYFKKGDEIKALGDFNKAIEIDPKNHNAYLNKAMLLNQQSKYKDSISSYEYAVNKLNLTDEQKCSALNNIGSMYDRLNEPEKALEFYNRAINTDYSDKHFVYYNRSLYYRNVVKDYLKSIDDIEKAIEIKNNEPIYYSILALNLANIKEYSDSLENIDKAITLDGNNSQFYAIKGTVLSLQERYEDSVKECDKAIELDNNCIDAINNRAFCYQHLYNYDDAINDYLRVLSIENDNFGANSNLSELYIIYKNQYHKSKSINDKMLAKELSLNHKIIFIILNIIAKKLLDETFDDLEAQLASILKENKTQFSWSFKDLENWLEKAEISKSKRVFIRGLIIKVNPYVTGGV
jgi:tetratricopeptide (TPR) repeat protein